LHGYAGRILHVDLENESTRLEPLSEEVARKYIGGIGMGIYLLLKNSKPGVEPFSPENPLILATGPFSGTIVPTGGNGHAFVTKSPQSYGVGESKSHGFFGAEMKRAGYDAIIITGKAARPTYLWIDDDSIQFMNAEHLWGKSIPETEDTIKQELGDFYIRVASIGPGGEKLIRFAGIANDYSRFAGRTGVGAVMGSKNLKAIAIRGTRDVTVAHPEELMELVKELKERARGPATVKYRTYGTLMNFKSYIPLQTIPTRNFTNGRFEGAEKWSDYINERFVVKIVGCASCMMRCHHIAVVPEGPYKDAMARLEYEPVWAFSAHCGNDRLDAVVKAIEMCNHYGIDGIGTGVIIGFVMDCYEHGLLTKEDLDGIEAHFGNHEAILELVRKIGEREGVGDILAEGVKRAAEIFAEKKGTDEFLKYACHIKGVEMTGYDIRALKTAALGYMVSFRGADHNRHGAYGPDIAGKVDRLKAEKGRGKIVKDIEDFYVIIDSIMVCKFSRRIYQGEGGFVDMANLYKYVTGFDMTPEELRLCGERINTVARVFNVREGLSRKDDYPFWKVMNFPIPEDGPSKGAVLTKEECDLLLDDYYEVRGWDKNGVPLPETLKRLGMEEFIPIVKPKLSKAK